MVTASVETNIVPSLFEKLMPAASSLRFDRFPNIFFSVLIEGKCLF
jgi:hypothetical protein